MKPSALHIGNDGVMYVSDLDLKQIIAIKIEIDGIFAHATIIGKVKFPSGDILSLSSKAENLYFAATGEYGGIFQILKENIQSSTDPANWHKIISNNSTVCGEVHSVQIYSNGGDLEGFVFSDMEKGTVNFYSFNSNFKVISGQAGTKGSKDGAFGLYQQPTSLCAVGSTIIACDAANKMVKLITPGHSLAKYLEFVDLFLRTFGVTLPGEKKIKISLQDGRDRMAAVKSFFDSCKEQVVTITGTENVQGPEGVNSLQTYKDIDNTFNILDHLIEKVSSINANYTPDLSSLTTLYVENFFSEMRKGNDMPTMLEFAYKFYSCVKERIKASTQTSFSYFTSAKSYYSKVQSNVRVNLFKTVALKATFSNDEIYSLRDWRCENGQSVRQMTVRNMSTKDKPGTLPMNCYSFQPDEPEPVNFNSITTEHRLPQKQKTKDPVVDVLFKKGSFATIKSALGCSVVRFLKAVYVNDGTASVEIYESALSTLQFVHSRNAEINSKTICKEVCVEKDDDIILLEEEDYYITMAASSEDTMTPDEVMERDVDHENDVQGNREAQIPGKRSSRKRVSTVNRNFVAY